MSKKYIISIGGGEIKTKTTLAIDEFICKLAWQNAGGRRPNALFIGTASHDFMPYFNSFRKVYTSVFNVKVDVALTVYREMDYEHIKQKFDVADVIYVGGGDTRFMIESWKKSGLDTLIRQAYERGVIICGLSAGAICWFEEMYTDSMIDGYDGKYSLMPALGYLSGLACPHYNERVEDFDQIVLSQNRSALAIENDCAVVFKDGIISGAVSSGGKAYALSTINGSIIKEQIKEYED